MTEAQQDQEGAPPPGGMGCGAVAVGLTVLLGVVLAVTGLGVVLARGNGPDPVALPPIATTASDQGTASTTTAAAPTTAVGPGTLAPTTAAPTTAAPTTAAPTTAAPTTAAPTTAAPTTAAPTTAAPAPPTSAPAVGGVAVEPSGQVPTDRPPRYAVFRGGKVYLRGAIPTQEAADELKAKAEAVVGAGNVIAEYQIDPAAPLAAGAPLYVEDLVLFGFDSSRIAPDFVPLLELGLVLLDRFPSVSVTVIGHTDTVGSPAYNQALSQRRVDAVIGWYTGRGIDRARLVGEARGEQDPLVAAGPEQAEARNRRVEFIITGLLDA